MCRLMVYLGTDQKIADLVTKPSRSLTRQSYDAKERLTGHGYLNGDGFGIGWYSSDTAGMDDITPCVFSSTQPAWNNRNLERLASKIVSPLIFAHVRAAYPGIPVSDSNCQPFVCGRYLWMHNGGIGAFHLVRRALLKTLRDDVYQQCPSFESDSAVSFALFLNQIDDPMAEKRPEELVALMESTINTIIRIGREEGYGEELSLLNFVVSDGKTVVASRYTNLESEAPASLYYASGSQWVGADSNSNQYFVKHSDRRGLLGIVASEPLTEENSDWIQVPRNNMVVLTRFKSAFVDVLLCPINPPPAISKDVSRCFKSLAPTPAPRRLSYNSRFRREIAPEPPLPAGVPVTEQPRHSMAAHSKAVMAIAVDGDRIFTGGQDGLIKLYDLRNFNLIKTLAGHSQTIFAISTHNGRLYSSSTRVVKCWDLQSYQLISTLRHSDGDVFALALAQGRAVAGPAGTSIIRCSRMSNGSQGCAAVLAANGRETILQKSSSSPTLPALGNGFSRLGNAKTPDQGRLHVEGNGYLSDSDSAEPLSRGSSVGVGGADGMYCSMVWDMAGAQSGGMQTCTSLPPGQHAFPPMLPPNVASPGIPLPNGKHHPPHHPALMRLDSTQQLSSSVPISIPRRKSSTTPDGVPGGTLCEAQAAQLDAQLANPNILGTSPALADWKGIPAASRATEPTLVLTDTERGGHCSRVYALTMCDPFLCSGAGDGLVKVWCLDSGTCQTTLYGHKGGVMALAAVEGDIAHEGPVSCDDANKHAWRLLSGSRDNTIRVWDMATKCPITTITGHTDDVLGLAIGHRDEFYSASSDHTVRMWSLESYECLRIFLNEDAIFLSVACTHDGVLTGSSDGIVRFWEVDTAETPVGKGALSPQSRKQTIARSESRKQQSEMEELLRTFVGIRTVSVNRSQAGQDQAWKGANFLKGLLENIGAEVKLVVGQENTNPVVMGRLIQDPSAMTITISGHYDVNEAPEEGWLTDPWELAALDGFLYGRGVSDCKGPIIATLSAVRELVSKGELKVNVIFVFDGMNENGCLGFREAVQANLEWFEGTQLILTSNSAWLSDNHPCLTYGMRGLICLVLEVTGPEKNLHSGSDGGSFTEPMNNLVAVLSNLVDSNNMILVPGFYDDVKPLDREEEALYEGLTFKLSEYKAASGLKDLTGSTSREVLMNRWRNPSLSILGIESGAVGWSTIPKGCSARICIRHVPNQDPDRLIEKIRAHAAHEFAKLRSKGNRLEVKVQHVGDWWLADPNNVFYRTAEQAIGRQWGVRPMYVREGGTMPVVPFLEKALEAPALHLPISQASDHTALQNERLRWINFMKGKDVVKDFLDALGTMDPSELPERRRSSGSH